MAGPTFTKLEDAQAFVKGWAKGEQCVCHINVYGVNGDDRELLDWTKIYFSASGRKIVEPRKVLVVDGGKR